MINIGSNRELFVDDYIIDTNRTNVQRKFYKPVKRDIAFLHDAPYETSGTVYHNILKTPEGKYFMYYKANHYGFKPDGCGDTLRRICVLQSDDGLNWIRPELDITPLEIAPKNNLISPLYDFFDNLFVFYDTNPKCPENERFKAIYGEWGNGLFLYTSEDGIHFNYPEYAKNVEEACKKAKIMDAKEFGCYFDSLNTMYFDSNTGKYVAFVRGFHVGNDLFPPDPDVPEAVRDIRYTESDDCIHWTHPVPFKYDDDFDYQLYANAIVPYYRAPQVWLSTPTRYIARENWNDSFDRLCGAEARKERGRGQSITDAIFMSSRDHKEWTRHSEAIFTPGPEHICNWIYGDCYPCVGLVETPSLVPGEDPYISMFCKEDQVDKPNALYRYTLRMDGFASMTSTLAPQTLTTKEFTFTGKDLEINFETSAVGYMKFTLKDTEGNEIHTSQVFGNKIDRIVGFDDGKVADFEGKAVTMEIEMSDASIYSFRFI